MSLAAGKGSEVSPAGSIIMVTHATSTSSSRLAFESETEPPDMSRDRVQTDQSSDSRRVTFRERTFSPMESGSQRGSVLALASTAFGAAILSLPWVFASLGAILATVLMLAAAAANFLSMRLLANAAYMTCENTYADVVREAIGPCVAKLVDALVFMYTIGCICSNMIFLEEFAPYLVQPLGLPSWLEDQTKLIVTLTICPLLPFALTKTVGALRYVMLLSQVGLVLVVFIMIAVTPSKSFELLHSRELDTYWWLWPYFPLSWSELPTIAAMLFFAFCCHVSLFSTYGELTMPTPRRVEKVFSRAVVVQFVVYFAIGFCGLVSFGPRCRENTYGSHLCTPTNILSSPRMDGAMGVATRLAMALAILVAIPLNTHASRAVFGRLFMPSNTDGSSLLETSTVLHVFVTVLVLGVGTCIAISYKAVTDIIGIVGGGCAASFMFTMPLVMTVKLRGRSSSGVCSSPHIGQFLGVTKHGARLAALLLLPCVLVGYAAAGAAVQSMLKHSAASPS